MLDRVDQFADFDPRQHYRLTVADGELTGVERAAAAPPRSTTSSWTSDMTAFDRLHPALQHHVVNTLGWRDAAAGAGAGHRRRSSTGPTCSSWPRPPAARPRRRSSRCSPQALAEPWGGLAVLYVCPIKALLNNLQERLERYYGLVGRRAAVWHGDVPASAQEADPGRPARLPADHARVARGDARLGLDPPRPPVRRACGPSWSTRSTPSPATTAAGTCWRCLQRIGRLAGRDLQRIGLSATVGNEDELLDWLSAGSDAAPAGHPAPRRRPSRRPRSQLDYVGRLDNAATVIAALHRGEKRLVFCDSRSRVEQLAAELRMRRVETFVSHSSLGLDERRQAEQAFAEGRDCVIVATSALELGIDVGDLDRVIQIDAPATVSSFLQRMGRTGRRPGTARNCLFLATSDEGLLRAAGLVDLWAAGLRRAGRPAARAAAHPGPAAAGPGAPGAGDRPGRVARLGPRRARLPGGWARHRRPDRRRHAREGDPLGRGGRALAGPRGPGRPTAARTSST